MVLAELGVGAMLGGGGAVAGACDRVRGLVARAAATGAWLHALPASELASAPVALLQRLRDEACWAALSRHKSIVRTQQGTHDGVAGPRASVRRLAPC